MHPQTAKSARQTGRDRTGQEAGIGSPIGYEPPSYQLICLACEISAYAPDGDTPLF
jgi:hypothetical protein